MYQDKATTPGGMTRRGLLGVGAGFGAALGFETLAGCSSRPEPAPVPTSGADLAEPAVLTARNGTLEAELRFAMSRTSIAGTTATVGTVNGTTPGPTLRVAPGDRLRLTVVNDLTDPTNLHTHGLHVSPSGVSDNPFVMIEPGGRHTTEITIPDNHPLGLSWYHPHHHGMVADQVFSGIFGALVVEREPATPPHRVLVVSDITITDGTVAAVSHMERMNGREGQAVLVNGQLRPRLSQAAPQDEVWQLVNACVARYLDLRLDGASLAVVGRDSHRYAAPLPTDRIVIPPGGRVEVLVTSAAGRSTLRAQPYDRGRMGGGMMGGRATTTPVDLLDLVVGTGSAPASAAPPIVGAAAPRDLRSAPVATRRTVRVGSPSMMDLSIDGRTFDPARTDLAPRLGTVEEWTWVNASRMSHPMHLHTWPMQVIEAPWLTAGGPPEWRDVVNVPAGGQVTVRIAFEDFDGRTLYHCHILDHEDLGMMATIEVT